MLPISGSISFLFYSARFDAFKLIHLCLDGIHCSFVRQVYGHKTIFTKIEFVPFSLRTLARRSTGLPGLNAAMLDITPPFHMARKSTLRRLQPQQFIFKI